ncbi:hypothetical protein Mapa_006987 [Marchantia paleacea]|nr:hypothetical protein Mapa_006987 [Marchantia paleacea]
MMGYQGPYQFRLTRASSFVSMVRDKDYGGLNVLCVFHRRSFSRRCHPLQFIIHAVLCKSCVVFCVVLLLLEAMKGSLLRLPDLHSSSGPSPHLRRHFLSFRE